MRTIGLILAIGVAAGLADYLVKEVAESDSISLGQAVYVAEGCIHCHSQYSRPNVLDTENYGPASELPSGDGDVLIGNRRQGPDLSNVGLRRSREWNRIHLMDPQIASPGSRMPSYERLFDGPEGELLLDYLASLVTDKQGEWFSQKESWRLPVSVGDVTNGKGLFGRNCAQCHGVDGRGDGVLAARFELSPTNLRGSEYRFAPVAIESSQRRDMLARVVKYGILGTSMPGHEYLTDSEIADLVAFVADLPKEI